MVNIRFHLVSLVAVFFALAIGIGVGSSVVRSGVLERTQSQLDSLDSTLGKRNREIAKLRAENEVTTALDRAVDRRFLDRSLSGVPVVVVTLPTANNPELGQVMKFLAESKADLIGVVAFSARVRMGAGVDPRFAAIALKSFSTDPRAVRDRLRELSVAAFSPGAEQTESLRLLSTAGFVTASDSEGARVDDLFVPPEARFIVLGSTDDKIKDAGPFAVPFVRQLSSRFQKRVVILDAEAPPVRNLQSPKMPSDSLVVRLRERANTTAKSLTLDGSLASPGVDGRVRRIALNLILRDGASGAKRHFGTAESATALLPGA